MGLFAAGGVGRDEDHELEDYVDHLQRSSITGSSQLSVTLRDVEEGAMSLRGVGETLAILKGEFPELQMKMRLVLRQEVEAMRFLKEAPLKMDSMLKRVKALTDTLSSLRRCVSESVPSPRSAQLEPVEAVELGNGPAKTQSLQNSPKPQPRSSVRLPQLTPPLSGSQAETPIVAHGTKSTAPSVVQTSQHSPSLPLKPIPGRHSPTVAKVHPRSREGSPALQRRTGLQESDELDQLALTPAEHTHSETVTTETQTQGGSLSGKARCMSQSSPSRVKQPANVNSSHTQPPSTSIGFNQVLQEVQASVVESVPSLDTSEVRVNDSASQHAARQITPLTLTLQGEDQALVFATQQDTPSKQSDQGDCTDLKPPNTAPAAVSQLPAAALDLQSSVGLSATSSASPGAECSSRPQVEKPRRSSLDKEMKHSPDRAGKSPPPPPPRRIHAVTSGLTTGRTGEVVFGARKEPVGAQSAQDEADKDKELVPQLKPPRQPPEVKHKSQMCTAAHLAISTSAPAAVSAQRQEEEEEEEEEKVLKELQVTELTNKNHSSVGNKQNAKKERTSLNSQVANELATCDQQSDPQLCFTNDYPHKLTAAAGLKANREGGGNSLTENKVETVIVPSCPTVKDVEIFPLGTLKDVKRFQTDEEEPTSSQDKDIKIDELRVGRVSQKENVRTPNQVKEFVGQVSSPATKEKKVKVATVVTLQKENIQGCAKSPKDTNETAKEASEKKSNVMVGVTLETREKERTSGPPVQLNTSLRPDQECTTPTSVTTPSPFSPIVNCSSKQGNLEQTVLVSGNQLQYSEDGGSLSCDEAGEGPPPPPPQICKYSRIISKTRVRPQSKEETSAKMNGSQIQTVSGDTADEPTYVRQENHGFEDGNDQFDRKPIIVFLNQPVDFQSAYKRLSTIFESEEDTDGIFSPESISDEEKTNQEEEERGIRKSGNGQNPPQIQHEGPSTDKSTVLEKQGQTESPSLKKTETKRKFKFKFPKKRLTAFSQAIRTGNRSKHNREEVVVEEEEVAACGTTAKETKSPTNKSQMFKMNNMEQMKHSESHNRVEELCKNTFDSIDSLEKSIKQLEIS
ncbi:sickle tail protein homolog, partial [Neolamprologus brichardi]|uniref:sickle tail protein homolog n=1 Tax=Neolamprologus brichardi TaxID=32507 RepID=UPI001643A2E5